MSATYDLFTRWKDRFEHPSDNAGAIALGVTRGAVSLWKKGRNAEADLLERMARELGEDVAPWAARAMAEQTQGEASRTWTRLARRFGAAATVAAVALFTTPLATVQAATGTAKHVGLHIMFWLRRGLTRRALAA